jgi:hypothetical protein
VGIRERWPLSKSLHYTSIQKHTSLHSLLKHKNTFIRDKEARWGTNFPGVRITERKDTLKTSGRKDKSAAFLFQLQALERDGFSLGEGERIYPALRFEIQQQTYHKEAMYLRLWIESWEMWRPAVWVPPPPIFKLRQQRKEQNSTHWRTGHEPQNIVLDLWSCHSEVHHQSETPEYNLDFTDTVSQIIILIGVFSQYLRGWGRKIASSSPLWATVRPCVKKIVTIIVRK